MNIEINQKKSDGLERLIEVKVIVQIAYFLQRKVLGHTYVEHLSRYLLPVVTPT